MQFTIDHVTEWKTPDSPAAIGFCRAETAHRLAGGPVAVAVRDRFTQVAAVVAASHRSLLRTDIDRFDEMGEGHGTVVMKHLAHVLHHHLRDDDVAARIDCGASGESHE